jgi:SAM-dependent methyltransferase
MGVYVHGYRPRESERLQDQADTLVDLLHRDTSYPAGSVVLEAGCGVGAQTVALARTSPGAQIISIDLSQGSLREARTRVDAAGLATVQFRQGDIFALSFEPDSFDHIFVCFVLEHLSKPIEALLSLKSVLRPGGTITVIEGDHGSAYFHPDSAAAHEAIRCQVELQRRAGGNAMIGRQVYPLLIAAGLEGVRVSPRMVYVDASKPHLVDGFIRKTFVAMVEGVRDSAIEAGSLSSRSSTRGFGLSTERPTRTVSSVTPSSRASGRSPAPPTRRTSMSSMMRSNRKTGPSVMPHYVLRY